jgi:hypothetical protein
VVERSGEVPGQLSFGGMPDATPVEREAFRLVQEWMHTEGVDPTDVGLPDPPRSGAVMLDDELWDEEP